MHILILGGTSFVGRALAVEAVSRKHQVTLFNRGTQSSPDGTTTLIGDRLAIDGLKALEGLKFDAVVDTWATEPEPVIRAAEALAGRVGHYTYISTLSVYDGDAAKSGNELNDEDSVLFDVEKPDASKSVYQFNKRSAEIAAEKIMGDIPCLLARPGVILGPYEGSFIQRGRLLWWLNRLQRGGPTAAPGPPDLQLQLIDARDLANFVLDGAEKDLGGAYNLVTAKDEACITMGQVLEVGKRVTGDKAQLVWKTSQEIENAGIAPFTELPLWLDSNGATYPSIYNWDTTKATDAGLKCRSIEETIHDTWEWMQGADGPVPAPENSGLRLLGLTVEKEAKLLGI